MALVGNKNTTKKVMFDKLGALGVVEVVVVWNGGGDSGGVESITAKGKKGVDIVLPNELGQEIDAFCMDWVDSKGYAGWYNNDGGFGQATFNVKKRAIEIDHENYSQSSESIGAEVL